MEEINEKLHMQMLDFNETKRQEWMKNRNPYSVLFELTARCNMNCIHCYLQNNHVSEQLSYDEVIEIIDILYEKGILFLTFTGGEILTRKDFVEIYMYAKTKGFLVELFTNGYLFTDEIIRVLEEYPPLLIDISLYGANEDTYYKVTGIKGAFERVITNCIKIKNAGIRVALKSPIIRDTLQELPEMKRIAEEIGIPFVYTFEICSTIDKSDKPKKLQVPLCKVLKFEFADYYEQVLKGDRQEKTDNSVIITELMKNEHVYTCNVALNSFIVDYQGRMCPCMKLRHKGIKLHSGNYDDIWEQFSVYSKLLASDRYVCKGCDAQYYCDVCPGEMDFLYGDMEYRPSSVCKIAKIRKEFYEGKVTFKDAIRKASFDE